EFDALLTQAKESTDIQERIRLYQKAQELFHEQVPWVPLAHSIVVEPIRKNVEGFKLDPTGKRRFHEVYFK
ncbi:MAG: ABC transporter substrate-binding protein, partial [Planctomycetota bacterium]